MAEGGRITLRLAEKGSDRVAYSAELERDSDRFASRATVTLADGAVSFSDWEPAGPPPWLLEFARATLRAEWRSKNWPRRITRWRAAKDG
jgi:hypothetical protein